MRRHQFTAALLGGCSVLAVAPFALAQESGGGGDIVVTGSRVIQNGNNMPTPVTVVTAEQITTAVPQTVADGLNSLPTFVGSRSATTNPGNSSQNNAANVLNLRNIGTTRVLVMFDGRRLPPVSPIGEVDTNMVPGMLLQRVDVVTGGVSAVYGSDAVAGVVNFITDKAFNGIKINAQKGISEYGDDPQERLGVAGGMRLGDRGHVEGSYEYFNDAGVFTKLTRSFGRKVWTTQGNGTVAVPNRLVENTRLSSTSFYGVIAADTAARNAGNPLRDMVFSTNGSLTPFQHGASTGISGVESGGDGGYFYQSSLKSLLTSHQVFGRIDYDLTDNISAYVEATGMRTRNMNNHQTNEVRLLTLSSTNAYLAPQYQQQMLAANKTTFVFSKMMQQAPPLQPETHTDSALVQSGLEGTIGDYKWDLSYVHSETKQHTRNNFNLDQQRLIASMDAVVNPANGQIVCNVTLTNPGLYPGCVPINLFGPTSESAEALRYIQAITQYDTTTKMDDFGGSIAGSPFSTWAGPVQVALSGEYRKTTYDLSSNAQPTPANCTGLRFNCTAGTLKYISNVVADAHGIHQSVKEGAVEFDVPLLKDLPLAESLNVNGAARYTDYDTSGSVTTWKAGMDWHLNGALTLRGTRSRDIRAPNLNELFAPTLINPAGVNDVHTNITGQAPFVILSNPNLKPEEADTITAGIVYRPSWLPRFSMSVDYYKVDIASAIALVQGNNATIQNICEASNGTSEYCTLIQRPLPFSDRTTANFVTAFLQEPRNVSTINTHGVDAEVNYSTELFGGNLNLRGLISYQPEFIQVTFPGAPVLNSANTPALRSWRVTAFVRYAIDKWTFDVQERWFNSSDWNADRSLIYSGVGKFPGNNYTNLNVSYEIRDRSQAFISIQNLFNQQPHPGVGGGTVPGLFGGYVPGLEDPIGRYYTVGVRLRY